MILRLNFLLLILCFGWSHSVAAEMADLPFVKIQALDKSTARTTTLKAKVGSTIEYGSLFIKVQACRQSGALDKPENAAFLQIWEVPVGKSKSEWAFSGWMFSSSPALSAMDHAVYDVWVLECSGAVKAEPKKSEAKEADDAKDEAQAEAQAQAQAQAEIQKSDDVKGVQRADQTELSGDDKAEQDEGSTRVEAENFDSVIKDLSE